MIFLDRPQGVVGVHVMNYWQNEVYFLILRDLKGFEIINSRSYNSTDQWSVTCFN